MMRSVQYAVSGASLLSGALALPAAQSYSVPSYGFTKPSGSVSSAYGSAATLIPQSYPQLNAADLKQVELAAHGTEPSVAPPATLSTQGGINFQFIEYNENFEKSYFQSWINNITNNVYGFQIEDKEERDFVIEALTVHLNQEIEHGFNARSSLEHFGRTVVDPCNYKFPTTTGKDATKLAKTFTDVVLGTLQDVSVIFAENGDVGGPGAVGSVIGNEGEQNGFYRLLEGDGLVPASQAFMTRSTRDFAFTALTGFVDGQCAGTDLLISQGLKKFGGLTLVTPEVEPKDQTLQFSFDIASLKESANIDFKSLIGKAPSGYGSQYQGWSTGSYGNMGSFNWGSSGLYMTYINSQNIPQSVALQNPKISGTVVTVNANFPYSEFLMNGLSLAAVTVGNNFTDARDVANHALFAPGLIEVN